MQVVPCFRRLGYYYHTVQKNRNISFEKMFYLLCPFAINLFYVTGTAPSAALLEFRCVNQTEILSSS